AFATVGRFVEAEREARRAVELQPTSLEARGELMQLLLSARRYGHAAAEAAAVIAMAPAASEAWYARGWALMLGGDESAGMDALLPALTLWGAGAVSPEGLRGAFDPQGAAAASRAAADLFSAQQVMYTRRLTDVAMQRALGGQLDEAFVALEA